MNLELDFKRQEYITVIHMHTSITIYMASVIEIQHILLHYVMFMVDSGLQRDRFTLCPENDRGVKRNSEGHVKCTCKGVCKNKLCGCRKIGSKCTKECKCDDLTCQNQDQVILYYCYYLLLTYNYQIRRVFFICSTVYPQFLSKHVV
jgi:hypothetical protein